MITDCPIFYFSFQLEKQDISYHLVKAQELRKLKTLRKKWFVLYEDPDSPIDPERKRADHRKARRDGRGKRALPGG